MLDDFNSGGGQVIRFPVELVARPTTDLLWSLAPDIRHVSLVAEAFGLDEPPFEIRDDADRAMAERIAMTSCWPEDANAKRAALEKMLKPLVERAIRLCRQSLEAGKRSDEAADKFVTAELTGGYWLQPLEEMSDARAVAWAKSLIEAYAASQEALGSSRAVSMAIRGETWRPFVVSEELEILMLGAAGR
jgi:hypothetical protein